MGGRGGRSRAGKMAVTASRGPSGQSVKFEFHPASNRVTAAVSSRDS